MNETEKQWEYMNTYNQRVERELELERTRRMQAENESAKISAYNIGDEKDLARLQIEVDNELDRIFHLISGHKTKVDSITKEEKWVEPEDDRNKIFSEYGVEQIMNVLSFYISKVHILSYYDTIEQVNQKVLDFGLKLADLISIKYELFFYYPKPEELFETLSPIILHNPRTYPDYVITENGKTRINEKNFYMECVKLSEQELENKLAHYPMICLSLIDSVHSTFMKAYRGETARNLRTIAHINQNINTSPQMPQAQQRSVWRPSTWKSQS